MSKMPNWRHYHIERNGNTVNERMQRYRRAWELVSRLARTHPLIAGGCSSVPLPVAMRHEGRPLVEHRNSRDGA